MQVRTWSSFNMLYTVLFATRWLSWTCRTNICLCVIQIGKTSGMSGILPLTLSCPSFQSWFIHFLGVFLCLSRLAIWQRVSRTRTRWPTNLSGMHENSIFAYCIKSPLVDLSRLRQHMLPIDLKVKEGKLYLVIHECNLNGHAIKSRLSFIDFYSLFYLVLSNCKQSRNCVAAHPDLPIAHNTRIQTTLTLSTQLGIYRLPNLFVCGKLQMANRL